MPHYHANGKLLISGEYLVMNGALALAIPCSKGQSLLVEEGKDAAQLHWTSLLVDGNPWISTEINPEELLHAAKSQDSDLIKVLKAAVRLRPDFMEQLRGKAATTQLEFSPDWGLGSSSTLVSLIAQWSGADAMEINRMVFGGSGYDIACAKSWMPIFYRLDEEGPVFDTVHFTPPHAAQLMLVHLGVKQSSREAVASFQMDSKQFREETEIISEISEALLFCDDFPDFLTLLDEHEQVMQYVLQTERVQTRLFNEFPGVVKSLGAWGGDFVLAGADMDPAAIRSYFEERGYTTIIPYEEMVLLKKPSRKNKRI
ncbi:MAG TPA: GHMP kinase [Bacteroidetes bacterium]|jgi:mevalonate kinase|nr:GHMP kinase [Bacteroidota bacterium]